VLQLVADRRIIPLVTATVFLEYEAVLKRPEQRAVTGFGEAEVDTLLDELALLCEPIEVHFRWRPMTADPDDDLILEAAVNGRADALVTYNVRDFAHAAGRFGIPVLLPRDVLQRVRS
jgi:predicted nucleic acid-binding protein